ncbi:hypothetical protein PIB30_072892 [Stylosanthes scabra]|uniref:Uncharacterized protein n=1 Tax=Stylosanthes scabra TaxID=79078 RepID=A0ABU6XQR3_9FABA|nr:hypothetical protein [Stylosanthes scabra]
MVGKRFLALDDAYHDPKDADKPLEATHRRHVSPTIERPDTGRARQQTCKKTGLTSNDMIDNPEGGGPCYFVAYLRGGVVVGEGGIDDIVGIENWIGNVPGYSTGLVARLILSSARLVLF